MKRGIRARHSHWTQAAGWAAVVALILIAVSCSSPEQTPSTAGTAPPGTSPAPTTTPESTEPADATTVPTSPPSTAPSTTVTPTTVQSSEFYVSPSGDDEDEGTQESPWATLQHALPRLRPGDTLIVEEGTYMERVKAEVAPATAEQPITVRAAADAEPVVEGLFWVYGPDHWILDGINVTWDPEENDDEEHMVKITDGVGWQLRNSELWGAESFAALLVTTSDDEEGDEPRDWVVAGNCIHDTIPSNDDNEDQLIYVNSGTHPTNGLIENNLLFGAENGSAIKLGGSSDDSGGAHGVTVRNNTIVAAAQGILVAWGSSNNTITGNLFAGTDEGYGHIRGYELFGENNVATGNGGDDHEPFILNDDGYTGVDEGEGNTIGLEIDPEDLTCDFQADGEAAAFGVQAELEAMASR